MARTPSKNGPKVTKRLFRNASNKKKPILSVKQLTKELLTENSPYFEGLGSAQSRFGSKKKFQNCSEKKSKKSQTRNSKKRRTVKDLYDWQRNRDKKIVESELLKVQEFESHLLAHGLGHNSPERGKQSRQPQKFGHQEYFKSFDEDYNDVSDYEKNEKMLNLKKQSCGDIERNSKNTEKKAKSSKKISKQKSSEKAHSKPKLQHKHQKVEERLVKLEKKKKHRLSRMRRDQTKGLFKPELISQKNKKYRNVRSSRDTLYSSRDNEKYKQGVQRRKEQSTRRVSRSRNKKKNKERVKTKSKSKSKSRKKVKVINPASKSSKTHKSHKNCKSSNKSKYLKNAEVVNHLTNEANNSRAQNEDLNSKMANSIDFANMSQDQMRNTMEQILLQAMNQKNQLNSSSEFSSKDENEENEDKLHNFDFSNDVEQRNTKTHFREKVGKNYEKSYDGRADSESKNENSERANSSENYENQDICDCDYGERDQDTGQEKRAHKNLKSSKNQKNEQNQPKRINKSNMVKGKKRRKPYCGGTKEKNLNKGKDKDLCDRGADRNSIEGNGNYINIMGSKETSPNHLKSSRISQSNSSKLELERSKTKSRNNRTENFGSCHEHHFNDELGSNQLLSQLKQYIQPTKKRIRPQRSYGPKSRNAQNMLVTMNHLDNLIQSKVNPKKRKQQSRLSKSYWRVTTNRAGRADSSNSKNNLRSDSVQSQLNRRSNNKIHSTRPKNSTRQSHRSSSRKSSRPQYINNRFKPLDLKPIKSEAQKIKKILNTKFNKAKLKGFERNNQYSYHRQRESIRQEYLNLLKQQRLNDTQEEIRDGSRDLQKNCDTQNINDMGEDVQRLVETALSKKSKSGKRKRPKVKNFLLKNKQAISKIKSSKSFSSAHKKQKFNPTKIEDERKSQLTKKHRLKTQLKKSQSEKNVMVKKRLRFEESLVKQHQEKVITNSCLFSSQSQLKS